MNRIEGVVDGVDPRLSVRLRVLKSRLRHDPLLQIIRDFLAGMRQSRDLWCGLGVRWCEVAARGVHGRRAGSGAARFITRLKDGRVRPA